MRSLALRQPLMKRRQRRARPNRPLTLKQRIAVLCLRESGETDEGISALLGIPVRKVRRKPFQAAPATTVLKS